jgi:restriction system protein
LEKKGTGLVRIIDQVKAFGPSHLVTANDVRALVGVVHMDRAREGFLTTTSDFTPMIKEAPLINRVLPHLIELVNGKQLVLGKSCRLIPLAGRRARGLKDRVSC